MRVKKYGSRPYQASYKTRHLNEVHHHHHAEKNFKKNLWDQGTESIPSFIFFAYPRACSFNRYLKVFTDLRRKKLLRVRSGKRVGKICLRKYQSSLRSRRLEVTSAGKKGGHTRKTPRSFFTPITFKRLLRRLLPRRTCPPPPRFQRRVRYNRDTSSLWDWKYFTSIRFSHK